MTRITYLGHSGFLLEFDDCAIIFDYYKGIIPKLSPKIPLYVLVSHRHQDHFNPEIFGLCKEYPNTTYILSYDVEADPKASTYWIRPDASMDFLHFNLLATDSTDEGVSFLLTLQNGTTIFHAGDLNWWTWVGEETKAEGAAMEARFKKEVAKLAPYPIHIAFLPLDPRQQERYYWGFDYYMNQLTIDLAFPMHFWGKDEIMDILIASHTSEKYRDKIRPLRKDGDCYMS